MNLDQTKAHELPRDRWREILAQHLRETCVAQGRTLLCLTGKAGSGKTTLARDLRRQGIPGFKPSEIGVIDDGVMTAPLFGLLNRRIRIPGKGRDDLAPFAPYLRGKKVVVYVAIQPEERLTACDILVRLRCAEDERRERLVSSRANGPERYEKSRQKSDDIKLRAAKYFDLRSD